MKRFYIAERFSFDLDPETEDNQIVDDDLSALSKKYKYFPKTKEELQNLVDELIKERGNEADLNDIYTGYVTDMSELFKYRSDFNGDISGWDVSNVKNMSKMFYYCKSFNQDISGWDVSSVEDMSAMFHHCKSFNQDIRYWNVSKVKNMKYMFYYCESFNSNLSHWDVSSVEDMSGMFAYCPLPEENRPKFKNL